MPVTPLFTTTDPFPHTSVAKSFYYPSSPVRLAKNQKQIVLSPESRRRETHLRAHRTQLDDFVSAGSNFLKSNLPSVADLKYDSVVSPSMDESWPTTEQPSSVLEESHWQSYAGPQTFNISDMIGLKQKLSFSNTEDVDASRVTADDSVADMTHPSKHRDEDEQRQSTLAKYIERFRHGAPESRTERQKKVATSKQDFWWLKSDSNTSLENSDGAPAKRDQAVNASRLTKSILEKRVSSSRFLPPSPGHAKTEALQRKADKLLEQSESSLNSSDPVVSTEGLGSNTSGSTVVTEDTPYRPNFTKHLHDAPHTRFIPKMPIPRGDNLQPADDILYQWRLRRKMDVAQEGASEPILNSRLKEFRQKLTTPVINAPVHFTAAPLPPETRYHTTHPGYSRADQSRADHSRYNQSYPVIASPQIAQKQDSRFLETGTQVDPHLHLLCDILPCPHENVRAFEALNPDTGISDPNYSQNADLVQEADGDQSQDLDSNKIRLCAHSTTEKISFDSKPKRVSERTIHEKVYQSDDEDRGQSRKQKLECNVLKYRQFLKAEKPHSESAPKTHDKLKSGDKFKSDERLKSDTKFKSSDKIKSDDKFKMGDKFKFKSNKDSRHSDLSDDVVEEQDDGERSQEQNKKLSRNLHTEEPTRSRKDDKSSIKGAIGGGLADASGPSIIGQAIGEAVRDNLDLSGSTQISISDGEPSLAASGQPHAKHVDGSIDVDASDSGSDDGWEDDPLLEMLRKQRAVFHGQLRDIDDLLHQLASEHTEEM